MNIKHIGSGVFSDVFSIGDGKAIKAFKLHNHNNLDNVNDVEKVVRAYWHAEVTAYQKLTELEEIRTFFPIYYGVADPHEILSSISNHKERYVKDCGILLELLNGDCDKASRVNKDKRAHIDKVLNTLSEHLENTSVWDSSVFIKPDGSFKIIDFGQWANSNFEAELHTNKQLTDDMRQKYLSEC